MNPDRWREIERLCQAALERPESQRAAFLDEACAGHRPALHRIPHRKDIPSPRRTRAP